MDYNAIIKEAQEKGRKALAVCQPQQFEWGMAESLTSNKIVGKTSTHGDFGGAYIRGIDGRSPFITWAKKNIPDVVQKDVYKGYTMYLSSYKIGDEQEMEKNEAFARAFAEVLNANGIKCSVKTYLS